MEKYSKEWLKKDDEIDAVRIISGLPGSGKSSFAKMLAYNMGINYTIGWAEQMNLESGNGLLEKHGISQIGDIVSLIIQGDGI